MKTGEVITQRLWTVCTDFLQEVGIVKKTPMSGTLMLVTHREAVQMLVAEKERALAVLRMETLDSLLAFYLGGVTNYEQTDRLIMVLQNVLRMGESEINEAAMNPDMSWSYREDQKEI